MNHPQPDSYKAYHRASHTVNKTRQVVMLYDGAIRFLQQGLEAIEKQDYETRYNKLTRASDIIIGLQACLDFDAGGNSAKVLFDFYSTMDARIFAIHRTNDAAACQAIIVDMRTMRDVWSQIDRGLEAPLENGQEKSAAPSAEPVTVSV